MGAFVDEFFKIAAEFNPISMTDGEIGLFSCLLVICPGKTIFVWCIIKK